MIQKIGEKIFLLMLPFIRLQIKLLRALVKNKYPKHIRKEKPKLKGKCIKAFRKEHGISQATLARLIGVTQLVIINWEMEKYKPNEKNLKKLLSIMKK